MSFIRQPAKCWHEQVPGARWFKADLHIHTIDDHPSPRAKMPEGMQGLPKDPQFLRAYARRFLQEAASRGIQVLGLTPHSPRAESSSEISGVWSIVEEWNSGTDDDGTPFREKIYAVFPGFEPGLNDGQAGLHLIFLFDPEVGPERYLNLFTLAMGGISPWNGTTLLLSHKTAADVFDEFRKVHDREGPPDASGVRPWSYIVLAPHIDGPKGLLDAQKGQGLQLFEHAEVAALELSDNKLPEEVLQNRRWLRDGMEKYRQAFFQGSDAYAVEEIGRRYTWLKLASPHLEALRQAFLASDSKMRIAFERGDDGNLREISNPPDIILTKRPWLKRVTVRGGASFFGSSDSPRETSFPLSPDLTCIIGGSMTGKSTFLDGLRVHVGAPLPDDEALRGQVEARGNLFRAGSPDIALECLGRDPTASFHEQWPAQFFTQNELQRLSQEPSAIEEILARLVSAETAGIEMRKERLAELDRRLGELAQRLAEMDQRVAEAEQARDRAKAARDALDAFAEAGIERLHRAGRYRQAWIDSVNTAGTIQREVAEAARSAGEVELPDIPEDAVEALTTAGVDAATVDIVSRWGRIRGHLEAANCEIAAWISDSRKIADILAAHEGEMRKDVERALAERGYDAAKLREFQELSKQAGRLSSYEANLKDSRDRLDAGEKEFARLQEEREIQVKQQRKAFDGVMAAIEREFGERIRACRIPDADPSPFDDFLRRLNQRGITRWWNEIKERWNDLEPDERPTPRRLLGCLQANQLRKVGMSEAVQQTFRESMTRARKRELAALRFPDRYVLELRMDDGSYRRLDMLSGGQRVSVLLSLLLETSDDRPLVIDQPEDELDNRFLWETVLPALKRLKGRRQVIVATHNANIVVNGDADLVIQLEATAHQGRVACTGAIEEPEVRDAIVRTVDGGAEAFRLRRRKYGF